MKTITLPLLESDRDIQNLEYPSDIRPGMYVWDHNLKQPILITDLTAAELHQSILTSRKRFASRDEIKKFRDNQKYPYVEYNTVTKFKAYRYAGIIYNLN